MIARIDSIRNFGIYKNFNWASNEDLIDFKEKNLIYGWNYSGKTTLSRIFSSLEKKVVFDAYKNCDLKISLANGSHYTKSNISSFPLNLLVFNSDYIRENLRWEKNEGINAIFFEVGEQAKISSQIADIEKKITQINGDDKIKGEKEKYRADIENYEDFEENLFTSESRRIKNDVFSSLIEFNKGHFKKQMKLVLQNLQSFILPKSEVVKLNKLVKIESPKEEVDLITYDFQLNELIEQTNEILVAEPKKQDVLKILDERPEAMKWVERGLQLNKVEERCLFCDNPINSDRIEVLNRYYQNEASKIRNIAQPLFEKIEEEKNKIEQLNFPKSIQDLNEGFQEQFLASKKKADTELKKYTNALDKIKNILEKKVNNKIYQSLKPIDKSYDIQLSKTLNDINTNLKANNEFSEKFTEIIDNERVKYLNHLVASFLKKNKYQSKKTRYEKAAKEIKSLEIKISSLEKEKGRLIAQKNSAEEGGQQLNYFIQSFLGKEDIEIKFDKKVKGYTLYRGSNIAQYLSEGEKMAISFSHFLVALRSLEKKGELKNTILFIDDPISSLDGNHVFQINAMLKDFLFKKVEDPNNATQKMWKQKCMQLFISTHNYEFFNLLKEMPTTRGFGYKKSNPKESRYFISRKLDNSEIVRLPKVYDDFKSEYHYLFKQIFEFSKESPSEKVLIMPNILRRFLEIYTLAKYPSSDEVDDRAAEIWDSNISKRICKPFHFFSHFNNIDRIGKHSELLSDVNAACLELLKQLKKDKTHYKALVKTI